MKQGGLFCSIPQPKCGRGGDDDDDDDDDDEMIQRRFLADTVAGEASSGRSMAAVSGNACAT